MNTVTSAVPVEGPAEPDRDDPFVRFEVSSDRTILEQIR